MVTEVLSLGSCVSIASIAYEILLVTFNHFLVLSSWKFKVQSSVMLFVYNLAMRYHIQFSLVLLMVLKRSSVQDKNCRNQSISTSHTYSELES